MIFTLLAILVGLFIVSYYFGGKDFFAPTTIQIMTFVFSCLMCTYYIHDSDLSYKIHFNTVLLLSTCLAMSAGIGIFTHHMFRVTKVVNNEGRMRTITPISSSANAFVFAVLLVTLFWSLYDIRIIGGNTGNFFADMFQFRQRNSHTADLDAQFPFVLRQLRSLASIFIMLYAFCICIFAGSLTLMRKVTYLLIIALCVVIDFLGGERSAAMNSVLACIIIYHLVRIKKYNGYKTYSLKFIFRVILLFCLVLWLFAFVRGFVGRNNKEGVLHYISGYSGASIINLDIYLQRPVYSTGVFGKYTFYRLISNLRNIGVKIPMYTIHQVYQSVQGVNLGNVYTSFMIYYQDFGLLGVYVLHGLSSLMISLFYEYTKKHRGDISIILFSQMFYSFVLTFFAERFFSSVFSISFVKGMIFYVIFYKIFMHDGIRFTFGKRKLIA